jgi:hypothetical protein
MGKLHERQVTVPVEVLDAEGCSMGYEVPVGVTVLYGKEKYGEDADGNRGEWRNVFEVSDTSIEVEHLLPLNSLQVEQVLKDAERAVMDNPERFIDDSSDEDQEDQETRRQRYSAFAEWRADSSLRGEVEDI